MIEKSKRSFLKAFSWRVTGTIDTMIISFIITGKLSFALSIGGVEVFTKIALYYLHERFWNKINYGRVQSKEIDYNI
ncbi:MAG: DUF2061 domain-containing protein [Elusimicrobia bacterium]|nr:DUF2061 domain-containing protein [Elusimicrobiota bacterium]